MREQTRRSMLRSAAAVGVGTGIGIGIPAAGTASATEAPGQGATCPPPLGPVRVGSKDRRYYELVRRGTNARFTGSPDHVRVVGSTEHVEEAVRDAVRGGLRVAVRGGGHCFEDFVDNPEVRMVIDMSGMTAVHFDPDRNAFAVETGATLGEVYRRLYLGWGVTIPGGWCPSVGAGGHVQGGGFGTLSRLHGLTVDHLYGVEVVTVDGGGRVRTVVATREDGDPHRDLWWAHTGGGGGNFGVVTRYWFRSPGAGGSDPARLLPAPPRHVLTFRAAWRWQDLDRAAFTRLLENHGAWVEANSDSGSPAAALHSDLLLMPSVLGAPYIMGQVSAESNAERLMRDHLDAISAGTAAYSLTQLRKEVPWLQAALIGTGEGVSRRYTKMKSAYAKKTLSRAQTEVAFSHMTDPDPGRVPGVMTLSTYGARVGDIAPDATAYAHRGARFKIGYVTAWANPSDTDAFEAGVRNFYRAMYAGTGGVPVPDEINDGAYINYPDADLRNPAWNTSDTPWHHLYYKDNYRRLQQVKAKYDPTNAFRHSLSIEPA
ncbi:FAD-binding oxidoreductase [Streptomyces lonegramiae]|uniref:FAD-binding protein n=1 Tax=Streptomyces lonegramiae TaxID=3075524 RepID=A0ABU2XPU0_9ACTN|nr:FAD-binding protein [Streptomyces sp. DSM 41529]MDT0547060.1 FAD-binding protein [Streptomyces sp. DSM 41529]